MFPAYRAYFFQRVFKPGMPDEVVAYFCVNGDKLLLSVYTLTTLPFPPQGSVSFVRKLSVLITYYNALLDALGVASDKILMNLCFHFFVFTLLKKQNQDSDSVGQTL